jgi:glycosyltransferase involved in cell wall biosynthesis
MSIKIEILYVLFPNVGAQNVTNLNSSAPLERLLNEVTYRMNEHWHLHLLSTQKVRLRKIKCRYDSYGIDFFFSKNPIYFLIYFLLALFVGTKIIKKRREIRVVGCVNGHVYQGLIAYLISRITHRKCIIRVNEDTIFAATLFFKKIKVLNRRLFVKIFSTILRRVERHLFEHVDWIVTHGPMDYKKIKKLTKKCSFVPLPLDVHKFKQLSISKTKCLKTKLVGNNTKIVLFVGRLAPIKGVKYLLLAFKDVITAYPDSILLIIGSGSDKREYELFAENLGIKEKVKFLGYVSHDKLPNYYNIADVYVLPSLREEFSNTIMEAMACGVPVVATDVGGNPYLIKNGRTGFLVPARNPKALGEKILYVFNNPKEARKVSFNAIREIRKYGDKEIGEKHKRIIRAVISDRCRCKFHS